MNFRVSKTVVINLGSGDLFQGFPLITARLLTNSSQPAEQIVGSLPQASEIAEFYRIWQSTYRALCNRLMLRIAPPDKDELEIDAGGITQVSQQSFAECSQQLEHCINTWLRSEGFLNIERQLRSHLQPSDQIHVIFETTDDLLHRLPWHCWDFFRDYPYAEVALSRPEYKRRGADHNREHRKKVRILAILGDRQGIDVEAERQMLQRLADADIEILVTPSRQEFNSYLWDVMGWDMLFFAGHSQTEGKIGRIYINENPVNNSLTIEQLEEALHTAIENGLKLAIFNSCDGVGLAQALGKLHIPHVIVMREPVPNRVAQEFLRYFLEAFAAKRLPLHQAMRQARRMLQGLEDDFPGASWLPVLCQNPSVETSTWLQLGGIAPCPYRGLFAFRETDAHLFFGREQVINDLVAAVKRKALVAVLGPSGSGKSSVVFAGLVPHLRRNTGSTCWQIISCRPGTNPFDAIAETLIESSLVKKKISLKQCETKTTGDRPFRQDVSELATNLQQNRQLLCRIVAQHHQGHPKARLLLIVDQFEELYTLCPEINRQLFLDVLLDTIQSAPAFTLVLTLRADFYGYALGDRRLSDALQGSVYNLGPMSRGELQRAIAQPAAQMQVKLESRLTSRLIQATWGHAGRLPLLEFCLTELWSQQQAGCLTHRAYDAIGGVEEALANHAERVYSQLHPTDQRRMQRIFVQLVEPGVGTDSSRRLATPDEVGETNWDLVSYLASARLVVTNRNEVTEEETVEIVHEALIRSWSRLDLWLQADGDFRQWQEELRRARRQWEESDCENEALLRGKRLLDAKHWYDTRQEELSSGDYTFIHRSLVAQEQENRQHRRRRRTVILSLIAGLLAALMLAGAAWWGWQRAAVREIQAIAASSEGLLASHRDLDALVEAIRAQKKLQLLVGVSPAIQERVLKVLQHATFTVVEYNRLAPENGNFMWAVAISPDDQLIASASTENTIYLWDRHGRNLRTLKGHTDQVWGVAFSPNGQLIASASQDGTVKLWNLDGKEIRTFNGHTDAVWGVTFSPDGQRLASASQDKTIKLWSLENQDVYTLNGHTDAVWDVAFNPNGQLIASASQDGTVKLWNPNGKEVQTLNGHLGRVSGVAFSPNGQLVASASQDGTVKLWNLDGTEIRTLNGHTDAVWDVAFSPDGQHIATASWDTTIKLWSYGGELMTTLVGHSARVRRIVFNSNNQFLVSSSEDKTVRLWRLNNTLLKILNGHRNPVIGISFSSDGQLIASASDDGTVKVWNQRGDLLKSLQHSAGVIGVEISPDGQTIATAASDGSINLWNINGTLLQTFQGHSNSVWDIAFSMTGDRLISAGGDHKLKLWSLDGTLLQTFIGHSGEVREVSFSPDGQHIASASLDKTVKLWSLDGELRQTFTGHNGGVTGLAFSPDGQSIASASLDTTIKLWALDGSEIMTFEGHDDNVRGVAFSPDGTMLISASGDGSIKLWKPDGTLLNTLRAHSNAVWKVAFSPDGQIIASTSEDKTMILWNRQQVQTLDPLEFGCNWVYDYLKTNPDISRSDRHLCDDIVSVR